MGAVRFGRYEVIRTIASGGMATVHLARAVAEGGFERLVAIKVMHPHIAADPDFRNMFMDEARLAARIRHPNVVGVIDTQNSAEGMFLVMEYVDGPSLHHLRRCLRRQSGTLPVGTTLRIFIDVLTGLHDAHDLVGKDGAPLRLIHRDVSPQNILVGRDGVSRITDFGVARSEARITSTRGGQLKGKIAYMPPEQLRNERLDRRVDVYSAGCALWEALSGRRLFRADSEAGLLHLILCGAQSTPSSWNPEVPPAIDEVCMRALSMSVEARQPTAAAFADELEEAARRSFVEVATSRQVSTFVKTLPELATDAVYVPSSPSARTSLPEGAPALGPDPEWHEPRADSGLTHRPFVTISDQTTRRSRWPMIAVPVLLLSAVGAYALLVRRDPVPSTVGSAPQSAAVATTSERPVEQPTATVPPAPAPVPTSAPSVASSVVPRVPEVVPPAPRPKSRGQTGPGYVPPEL